MKTLAVIIALVLAFKLAVASLVIRAAPCMLGVMSDVITEEMIPAISALPQAVTGPIPPPPPEGNLLQDAMEDAMRSTQRILACFVGKEVNDAWTR